MLEPRNVQPTKWSVNHPAYVQMVDGGNDGCCVGHGVDTPASGTITTNGTALEIDYACPFEDHFAGQYTATPTSVLLHWGAHTTSWTRQP